MKITALYVYPVKALRGINLEKAHLGPQGLQYDRRFMICKIGPEGELVPMQMVKFPECALFDQQIVQDEIHVQYNIPEKPLVKQHKAQQTTLKIPLEPELAGLERSQVNLHRSMVSAYRMGGEYDTWFTACFGFEVCILHIGQERRPILGTFSPRNPVSDLSGGWISSLYSYVLGSQPDPDWLTFSDMAAVMVATESSLQNVRERMSDGTADMIKFRPNIVVDGTGQFDEDYWAELSINDCPAIKLTKLCNRCASLNVDYTTGRFATGEQGNLLKRLMSDRRVDPGSKWSPCFGRYGFLADGIDGLDIAIGDEVAVTERKEDRPTWDWPMNPKTPGRYYQYR